MNTINVYRMLYCLREKAIGRQKKILHLVCDLQRVCLPVLKNALIGQNTISKAARVKLSAFFFFFFSVDLITNRG